jgi:hypothetical protein
MGRLGDFDIKVVAGWMELLRGEVGSEDGVNGLGEAGEVVKTTSATFFRSFIIAASCSCADTMVFSVVSIFWSWLYVILLVGIHKRKKENKQH